MSEQQSDQNAEQTQPTDIDIVSDAMMALEKAKELHHAKGYFHSGQTIILGAFEREINAVKHAIPGIPVFNIATEVSVEDAAKAGCLAAGEKWDDLDEDGKEAARKFAAAILTLKK